MRTDRPISDTTTGSLAVARPSGDATNIESEH